MISPGELAEALGGLLLNPPPRHTRLSKAPFAHVAVDSRDVQRGDLFVALAGERHDGHAFLPEAIQRGAAAVLAREAPRDAGRPAVLFRVAEPLAALQRAAARWRDAHPAKRVGITGSVGKTTTREVVAQVLAARFPTLEAPRNYNSAIGLPISLLGLGPAHRWAVLELGPYDRREMTLLCDLARAEIGIVTNVGPTHLERFGSLDAIEATKGLLPASLPAGGLAVLNADDPRTLRMRARTKAEVVTFGLSPDADVRAGDVRARQLDGIRFTLHLGETAIAVQTPLLGRHNTLSAVAAAAVAQRTGFSPAEIADALAGLRIGRRLQPRRAASGALLLDDAYNAAPLSMRAALDLLAELPGHKIAVLGDMLELGAEAEGGHREVGAYAATRCDRLLAIGERARAIADAAREAGLTAVIWYAEKEEATAALRDAIGRDDVVLIKASHGLALESVVEALVTR